jgi:amidohydrolase
LSESFFPASDAAGDSKSLSSFLTEKEKQELVARRRDFHAHPEIAYKEKRTSEIAARHLQECGYEVATGVAETGVVGLLRSASGSSGKTLMLRADMDCLPVTEENAVPYSSQNQGFMHACGHDGHTAVLMTVAKKLIEDQQKLKGNLKVIFQPAEEGGNGAEKMVQQGVLENPRVDAAFGLHVWTSQPVGKIALNRGALLAGVDGFEVQVIGRGGHGAAPHQTIDPIVTAAQMITSLQTIISRNVDPLATAVVTVGSIQGGSAFNVIPDRVKFLGTVRYLDPSLGDDLPKWMERVIGGIAEANGCRYELKYEKMTPPTINDARMAEFIRDVASEVVGAENVVMDAQTMGGEDMSFFLNAVPGCFFFVGARNDARNLNHPHHSPHFDFDEAALEIGAEILYRATQKFLS